MRWKQDHVKMRMQLFHQTLYAKTLSLKDVQEGEYLWDMHSETGW